MEGDLLNNLPDESMEGFTRVVNEAIAAEKLLSVGDASLRVAGGNMAVGNKRGNILKLLTANIILGDIIDMMAANMPTPRVWLGVKMLLMQNLHGNMVDLTDLWRGGGSSEENKEDRPGIYPSTN